MRATLALNIHSSGMYAGLFHIKLFLIIAGTNYPLPPPAATLPTDGESYLL